MAQQFFVTGTDTAVGKTLVSCTLLALAEQKGLSTVALKPVAAGCLNTAEGLRNDDALALQQYITADLAYSELNPIALKSAIAPHIAAVQQEQYLEVEQLVKSCQPVLQTPHDFAVVEGAGGWLVPLNPRETLADFAVALNFPVVMVVGLRLGCINHALLTSKAIENAGLNLVAWVANQLDRDMPVVQENLAALAHSLNAPCLGHIPFLHQPDTSCAMDYLNIDKLLASSVFCK